jgi:Zn-dependent peptidase ImmA (M78 family)
LEVATHPVLERPLTKARYSLVERRADELTEAYSSPPIPALEIAESHGVDVIFDTFDAYKDTMAGFCDFSARKIYVNSADHVHRQNFTIAHELGHWILHREYFLQEPGKYTILPRFQSPNKHDPFEQEANCFAANLLVPKRLLLPIKDAPVSVIADIFIVSREMMEYRLKNV